jgi:PhnB protein
MGSSQHAMQNRPPLAPYLVVKGASRAIDFYVRAFGAKELFRLTEPGGKVGHAELDLGGCRFMLADEYPDFGALSPVSIGGSPVSLHLYVPDVDAVVERATSLGATLLRPVQQEFFGDRTALLADPFGHKWHVATQVEVVSPEEMQRRWSEALSGAGTQT